MSDYETRQKRVSVVVGVFVIVAVIAFFWMIFKFGDLPILVSEVRSYEVKVQFANAPGVQRDTPVRFCGYQIGTVTEVRPPEVLKDRNTSQYYYQSMVIMSIDNRYNNIPEDVQVRLMTRGLGSSYIELQVPPRNITGGEKVLHEGSLLQGATGMTSEFFPEESQKKLDELITGVNSLVQNANVMLGDKNNQANIKATLAHLAAASEEAKGTMQELQGAAAAGKTAIANADTRLDTLTVSLVKTSDKLGEVLAHLERVIDKMDNGTGTAGRLINDGRLYEQLLEDSRQLDLVLKELRTFMEESRKKGVPIKLK